MILLEKSNGYRVEATKAVGNIYEQGINLYRPVMASMHLSPAYSPRHALEENDSRSRFLVKGPRYSNRVSSVTT